MQKHPVLSHDIQRDEQFFTDAYEHYQHELLFYLYRRVGETEAENLLQDVFLKAWNARNTLYDWNDQSVRAWLYRIATNAAIDYYRHNRCITWESLEACPELLTNLHDPRVNVQDALAEQDLYRALFSQLNPTQQHAIQLSLAGYTLAEISQLLCIKYDTVKMAVSRAYRKLRKLKEQEELRQRHGRITYP